ncbi:MFS transporter [Streptomyces sp. WMMB 322]|uniref:MFS transporter n=1 Tax=Streptomyces sp. WMMB 322 TaxID=1286821 RepID=UPI000823B0F1|nr:MFS transporter [Streptomyces sp. WMMB 322]SCK26614.1 drug resistance transporter, EmrB/QacA subfamily [Streptomyces sp. WMMB 322]
MTTSTMTTQPDPRRWWALAALGTSMLVLGFDLTILNVALPAMGRQLGAGTGQMQWIVDAYIVVFAAAMLPAGLLGDRFGRRRLLVAGLTVFLAASLLGGLAGDAGWVIAARALMGLGAALVTPLALSVIPSLFQDEKERTKAVGIITASVAGGMPLGPLLGGWLLDHFWWGSVFLVNVPLAALGILVCLTLLPESRDESAPHVDALSAVLSVTGLGALVFGIIEGPARGWSDPYVVGTLAASPVLLAALVLRERRVERPMLDLNLLSRPTFARHAFTATLITLVLAGLLFVLPQYLQAVLGVDAFGTGLRLLPLMAGLLVAARASGPAAARFGSRPVISAGLVVLAFAAFLGARTEVGDGYGPTATWLTITGFGVGFAMVPAMDGALAALPATHAGSGSGLLMTVRQTGAAIGIAALGSLLSGTYTARLVTDGLPAAAAEAAGDSVIAAHAVAARMHSAQLAASADAAFVDGMTQVLFVCGCAALAAALTTALLPAGSRRQAPETEAAEEAGRAEEGPGPGSVRSAHGS